jgi:flagellar biogenesis protein FliO
MTGYLVNFAIYTMAMLGLIFFALMVYKKFAIGGVMPNSSKHKALSIEETISIAPRKTLYIVKAGDEKFLIAGDMDKTTLISKLSDNNQVNAKEIEISDNLNNEIKHIENIQEKIQPISSVIPEISNENIDVEIKEELKSTENIDTPKTKELNFKGSSVDDLPIIVDFQKKTKQNPSVIHDMLKKING